MSPPSLRAGSIVRGPTLPEPVEVLPNMLLRSQRWNEVLLDSPQAEGEPTLLLGIESLVDRAMTRNTRDNG